MMIVVPLVAVGAAAAPAAAHTGACGMSIKVNLVFSKARFVSAHTTGDGGTVEVVEVITVIALVAALPASTYIDG